MKSPSSVTPLKTTALSMEAKTLFNDRTMALSVLQSFDHSASNNADAQRILDECEALRQKQKVPPPLLEVIRLYCEFTLLSKSNQMQCVSAWLEKKEVITIPNIFIISKSEPAERIKNYLERLAEITSKENWHFDEDSRRFTADGFERFLTRVKIEVGFVAPMFLIDGLMSKFDENWGEVIQGFEHNLRCDGKDMKKIQQFRQLQLFTFDCWLLWGPSIRVCQCDMWTKQNAISALQFGFGDENNSLPLTNVFNESDGEQRSFEVLRNNAMVANRAPATRHELTARIIASSAAREHICEVQQELPPFLLDYIRADDISGVDDTSVDYYSAYLWAMFVLCRRDRKSGGLTPYFDGSEGMPRWQGMVPVFVHGNIADPQTYSVSKAQLAYKALSTLHECVSADSLMGRQCPIPDDMVFVYTCAFDDSGGCIRELARDGGFEQHDGSSIAGLLDRLMEGGKPFAGIRNYVRHYNELASDELRSVYSACHLPEVIENFYSYIETVVHPSA